MLSYSQIQSLYDSDTIARHPEAILKEYLQHELLDSLFKQKGSEHLSFIGGTSIRIVYGSKRFSEDLDFDNFGLDYIAFEKLLEATAGDMGNKGFVVEFRAIEKGAYHGYIKFPDILETSGLHAQPGEKILIRIDTVRKEKIIAPITHTLNNFGIYRKILANPASIILSQKLITIIQRKREKGRDLYDVSFLLGSNEPDYEYIKAQYGMDKNEFLNQFKTKLAELNIDALAQDVLPFLMNPTDIERVLSFRQYIEQRLR